MKKNLYILATLACVLWGSNIPGIKAGYRILGISHADTMKQLLLAGIVFVLSGMMTVVIGSLIAHKPLVFWNTDLVKRKGKTVPAVRGFLVITEIALLQTVGQYAFLYIGLSNTSGVQGSIITASNAFFSILLSCFIFRQERFTVQKIAGCLLGLLGIVVMNLEGSFGNQFRLTGEGFVLLAAISVSLAVTLVKKHAGEIDPVLLSGWQSLLGGVILLGMGLLNGASISFDSIQAIGIVLYISGASALAYAIWCMLLAKYDVSSVTVFGLLEPVVGVLLSVVLLMEFHLLSISCFVSLILVCIGIYYVNARPHTGK